MIEDKRERTEKMENVLDYLEKTAKKYPTQIAVEDENTSLMWAELVYRAKRIGSVLCDQMKRQDAVVIVAEKSTQTLAHMFGVLYAGGFYVMVDPMQPQDRIQRIFSVLRPSLVIADEKYMENVKQILSTMQKKETEDRPRLTAMQTLLPSYDVTDKVTEDSGTAENTADQPWNDLVAEVKLQKIRAKSRPTDILYGIFTSGSTGMPKGIAVSHGAVIDFISHFTQNFSITKEDRLGNQAPFDFDVSVKDIYSCVMTGATLVLIPRTYFSAPPLLLDYLCDRHVTSLTWAVSALTIISSLGGLKYRVPTEIKRVMFSGEVMPNKQLKLWQEALPDAMFVNLYGPSEITCNCTYHIIDHAVTEGEKLPIGKAFAGRSVFLLDEHHRLITEAGRQGEICVSGQSLANGYYNNELETRKQFCYLEKEQLPTDITGQVLTEGQRFYRTGDLGYFDEEGLLYFCGRKDFQIKHMGHRIELEEIEQALDMVPNLKRSCCLMDTAHNRIVAFYLGNVKSAEIRRALKEHVPDYMVPRKFIQAETFPLNKNGKTDRAYFKSILESA